MSILVGTASRTDPTAAQVGRELNVSLFTLSRHKTLYRQVSDQARAARENQAMERRRVAVQEAEDPKARRG